MTESPQLRALRKASEVARSRPELLASARDAGATWDQVAEAAGLSRAGAIKMYNAWKAAR